MKLTHSSGTNDLYLVGAFMCRPFKNTDNQLIDLQISWQNTKIKRNDTMPFLVPGVRLSALVDVGIVLPVSFWHDLETEGVAVYSPEGSYAGFEWQVLETDETYLLTVRTKDADSTESHLAQLALVNSEKRFKAIFNSAFQFIALTDIKGTVLEINQTALDAGALRLEEVIGMPFWETYWWQISPHTKRQLQASLGLASQGHFVHYEVDHFGKKRAVITVDFSIIPIRDDDGKVILLLIEGHDITEQKRTRAALLESEQRFQDIAENVDELFWIRAVGESRFLYMNSAYERITGKNRQSLYENPLSYLDFVLEEDRELLVELSSSDLAQNRSIEFRVKNKEGMVRWLLGRIFMVKDECGNALRRIGIASDITPQKEKELLLTRMLDREKELNQLRSQFVAFVSHEFRTPLTTIQSSIELMEHYLFRAEESKLSPTIASKVKHHISVIHSKIRFFADLLTDTLTINQIEAGKISFRPCLMDVTAFSQKLLLEYFHDRPDGRKVESDIIGRPVPVAIDEKLMTRIFINLLSNAFKFSTDNPVLRLEFEKRALKIDIIDRGIGIPEEDIPCLFNAFFRAGNVGKIAGTGLGLQITKQLVDLHGGAITVNSRQNVGTTMRIVLPLAYDELANDELANEE